MTDPHDRLVDALAAVYMGASAVEADALLDQLIDRGLVVVDWAAINAVTPLEPSTATFRETRRIRR